MSDPCIYIFSGLAGVMQRRAPRLDVLTRELIAMYSNNDPELHAQLSAAMPAGGGYLDPATYKGDYPAYQAANYGVLKILRSEVQLRTSLLLRSGKQESPRLLNEPPLIDRQGMIVDFVAPPPDSHLYVTPSSASLEQLPGTAPTPALIPPVG